MDIEKIKRLCEVIEFFREKEKKTGNDYSEIIEYCYSHLNGDKKRA